MALKRPGLAASTSVDEGGLTANTARQVVARAGDGVDLVVVGPLCATARITRMKTAHIYRLDADQPMTFQQPLTSRSP